MKLLVVFKFLADKTAAPRVQHSRIVEACGCWKVAVHLFRCKDVREDGLCDLGALFGCHQFSTHVKDGDRWPEPSNPGIPTHVFGCGAHEQKGKGLPNPGDLLKAEISKVVESAAHPHVFKDLVAQ